MTNREVLQWYRKGWEEENDIFSKKMSAPVLTGLAEIAYNTGRLHFIVGDDVSSVELLTEEEILKIIYEQGI